MTRRSIPWARPLLEFAHAEARKKGSWNGIPCDELLPMLPAMLDELSINLALVALEQKPRAGKEPHLCDWLTVSVGTVDPRIAHYKKAERLGVVRFAGGHTLLVGECDGFDLTQTIQYIASDGNGLWTEHWLCDFHGHPVRFCGRDSAVLCANEIAADFRMWHWRPPIPGPEADALNGPWTFHPNSDGEYCDLGRIGPLAQVEHRNHVLSAALVGVSNRHYFEAQGAVLFRSSRDRLYAGGTVLPFPDLASARAAALAPRLMIELDEDALDVDEDAFDVDEDAFAVDEDGFEVDEDAFEVDEDAFEVDEDAFEMDEDAFDVDEDA
jgi:hypothetical protein